MEAIKNTIVGIVTALFSSQSRISYRRIAVFGIATALLLIPTATGPAIDADIWAYIALAYIAGDSAEKALAVFRR
jgi:hypothetical protein